eukprot:jgi/Undpi1/12246/HiC_scaffold_5.g01922.m1
MPPRMLAIIRQFHDVAYVRLDDGECLDKFDVGQGLRQGCVLAPLLFNMFCTAVLRVGDKRFLADAAITDSMVQLQRKKEKGEKKGTSRTGKFDGRRGKNEEEVQRLWGMLCADDAGVVSRSSMERMMTVIVTACSAFGLAVSKAKTELCACKPKARERCRSPSMQPASAMLDRFPCGPCRLQAYCCCPCTLGLSLLSIRRQAKEIETGARAVMSSVNENLEARRKEVRFDLKRKWCQAWVQVEYGASVSSSNLALPTEAAVATSSQPITKAFVGGGRAETAPGVVRGVEGGYRGSGDGRSRGGLRSGAEEKEESRNHVI